MLKTSKYTTSFAWIDVNALGRECINPSSHCITISILYNSWKQSLVVFGSWKSTKTQILNNLILYLILDVLTILYCVIDYLHHEFVAQLTHLDVFKGDVHRLNPLILTLNYQKLTFFIFFKVKFSLLLSDRKV